MAQLKKAGDSTEEEKGRIMQLQLFNMICSLIYSVFFIGFFVYIFLIFIVGWYALAGVLVSLLMVSLLRVVQKKLT
ncbi:hypothetical protein [Cytobacillus purgationiresistens]|uniref:Membrane protein YqjE n=1 Tax=Cytobacillus purgationiresistens TaxID=863449 RepID=A0ABU0ACV7_9BACI|nr:hypothetical protein [Cytobacillus purgationiresistens]MDQ0269079.1 putative membrane protein YqjE [Cytobacillus purgationiresistens]